jgi:hypothetical protein
VYSHVQERFLRKVSLHYVFGFEPVSLLFSNTLQTISNPPSLTGSPYLVPRFTSSISIILVFNTSVHQDDFDG